MQTIKFYDDVTGSQTLLYRPFHVSIIKVWLSRSGVFQRVVPIQFMCLLYSFE